MAASSTRALRRRSRSIARRSTCGSRLPDSVVEAAARTGGERGHGEQPPHRRQSLHEPVPHVTAREQPHQQGVGRDEPERRDGSTAHLDSGQGSGPAAPGVPRQHGRLPQERGQSGEHGEGARVRPGQIVGGVSAAEPQP
ncbi:hypothetical protein ACFH04_08545 [Streptomyces noboritoensis]|uniref:Uncharacterized protein n=1 Tax=Streptomyces noboritoensis TaxID=67337 RepID=A0ABV6TD81_9ACTN